MFITSYKAFIKAAFSSMITKKGWKISFLLVTTVLLSYRVGKVLCHVRYRFVFIDPVILPPSSLIMRLHGYPRSIDLRVKKKWNRRGGREIERICLIWSHVSRQINVGSSRDQAQWRSHCVFYYLRDGSLIWNPPHAHERGRGDIKRLLFTRSFRCVRRATLDILFISSSPPARREKSSWKKLCCFLEIADSQAIISVRRVRSGHGRRVHCPLPHIGRISFLLPLPPFSFFLCPSLSRRYPLSLLSTSSREVNGFGYKARVEMNLVWMKTSKPRAWGERGR